MVGLFMLAVALLATSTAYAGFQARATATSAVSSGTLDLVQSADIGHGFSAFVAPAAPGDQDNVYVNVSNTGSLATVAGMKLWVAATPANALTNGQVAGEARIPQTVSTGFSFEDTFDVGEDSASPVGDYESPFPFTGTIDRIDLDIAPDIAAATKP